MSKNVYVYIGSYLESLRKRHGYSLADVEQRTKIGKTSLHYYETAQRVPSYDIICDLLDFYGVDVDEAFIEFNKHR